MVRRIFYTSLALALSGSAFCNADPQPDVNLFGVLFLFMAYVAWFYWGEIQAGYAYLEESRVPRDHGSRLMLLRFAPMYLRELTRGKRRRR